MTGDLYVYVHTAALLPPYMNAHKIVMCREGNTVEEHGRERPRDAGNSTREGFSEVRPHREPRHYKEWPMHVFPEQRWV